MHPAGEVGFNELLGALAAGEPQPDGTALPLDADLDVKERAAKALSRRPFHHLLNHHAIRRELKLEAVRQFADTLASRGQRRPEHIEMARSRSRIERQTVAREGRFGLGRLRGLTFAAQTGARGHY